MSLEDGRMHMVVAFRRLFDGREDASDEDGNSPWAQRLEVLPCDITEGPSLAGAVAGRASTRVSTGDVGLPAAERGAEELAELLRRNRLDGGCAPGGAGASTHPEPHRGLLSEGPGGRGSSGPCRGDALDGGGSSMCGVCHAFGNDL